MATVIGNNGNNNLDGTSSNDSIRGGRGDDTLNAFSGSDTYQYRAGDGNDVLNDNDSFGSDIDTLLFSGRAFRPDNAIVRRIGETNDLEIRFSGVSGSVLLQNQLSDGTRGVERVTFGNGVRWDEDTLWNAYLGRGARTNDDLLGTESNDTIFGGRGNDTLEGRSGSDIYRYRAVDGNDFLSDLDSFGSDIDELEFFGGSLTDSNALVRRLGTSNDLESRFLGVSGASIVLDEQLSNGTRGIERVTFGNGVRWDEDRLWNAYLGRGLSTDDALLGTESNDTILGGRGNDTLSGRSGSDIYQYRLGHGEDTLSDLDAFGSDIDELAFTGRGFVQSNAVVSRISGTNDLEIRFIGISRSRIRLDEQLTNGTRGVEQVTFTNGVRWDEDRLWNAYLGRGASTDDNLLGTNSNDTIIGGRGRDTLAGRAGSDRYRYNLGDGDDILADLDAFGSDIDSLTFMGNGLVQSNAIVRRIGDTNDLEIRFLGISRASIRLDEQLSNGTRGLERVTFTNGVSWDEDRLWNAYLGRGDSTDDNLLGTDSNDTIFGGRGRDTLAGRDGSDIYRYNQGDGDDILADLDSFGNEIDRLILSGRDLVSSNVIIERIGSTDDLEIRFQGVGGSIRLDEQLDNGTRGIERLIFDDGVVWGEARLLSETRF